MKNSIRRLCLKTLLLILAFPTAADEPPPVDQTSQNTGNLVTYLLNLGGFLGYDLKSASDSVSQTLLSLQTEQTLQNSLFNSLLGAVPVNAFSQALSNFVPSTIGGSKIINALANNVFLNGAYTKSQGTQSGAVTVSTLIDQKEYQADPVSQSVLNILSTPSYSFCMNTDQTALLKNCTTPLTQNMVTANVIGSPLPSTQQFFSYQYNQQFLSQLNSNVLVAPLMYSTTADTSDTGGSDSAASQAPGLPAATQAQQAANFIRYATASVIPPTLPTATNYNNVYTTAMTPPNLQANKEAVAVQLQAQTNLTNYLAKLRVYAAQMSVGVGNLYYIFQKRMPQTVGTDDSTPPISQALSEFNMATWRLFSPDQGAQKKSQWIEQINTASAATVQKEIVTLLAEINYQLYLTRQQQERMLLTESLVLLQNVHGSEPDASFSPNNPDSGGPSPSKSGS